eukprot:1024857-Heterocapsa_arctica.AAC.1
MEHDLSGGGLAHLIEETGDIHLWGGVEQTAVFAHIHNTKVEVHGYGMEVQTLDRGELKLEQEV